MWKMGGLFIIFLCGCANQSTELTPEEGLVNVYSEEPKCDYDQLRPITIRSGGADMKRRAVKKLLTEAVDIGANGVIVHFEGPDPVSRGNLHLIKATAIRCVGD